MWNSKSEMLISFNWRKFTECFLKSQALAKWAFLPHKGQTAFLAGQSGTLCHLTSLMFYLEYFSSLLDWTFVLWIYRTSSLLESHGKGRVVKWISLNMTSDIIIFALSSTAFEMTKLNQLKEGLYCVHNKVR